MLLALLLLSSAQPMTRVPVERHPVEQYIAPRFRWSRSDGRYTPGDAPPSDVSYAFFEAFPLSGAGMPAACSATAPTGAKGEVLTFTRTGNATCSKKGLATTGIADGDLVAMSGNVARVEPDSDGVLGLRVEGSRTNYTPRSEEINNASWGDSGSGAPFFPVLNGANAADAPDGVTTAEDFTFGGAGWTTTANYSYRVIAGCPGGVSATGSIYVKSISGGTTFDVTIQTGAASWSSASCTINTSTWTRCSHTATTGGTNQFYLGIGQVGVSTTRSTTRALVWGAQCEAGAYATSYIPTTSAAVTRNVELAYFTPSGLLTSPLSIAGSIYAPATSAASPNTAIVSVPATSLAEGVNLSLLYGNTNGLRCWNNGNYDQRAIYYGGGQERAWCAIDRASATAADRVRAEWPTGTALTEVTNGSTGSGSTAVAVRIGDFGAAGSSVANGIISRVCVDPDPTRCR